MEMAREYSIGRGELTGNTTREGGPIRYFDLRNVSHGIG